MPIVLGSNALGYDHFGNWTRRLDGSLEAPDGLRGDPSWPASCQPGAFMLLDDLRPFRVEFEVTQAQ